MIDNEVLGRLSSAVDNGRVDEVATWLATHPEFLEERDKLQLQLWYAINHRHLPIVETLLTFGADINAKVFVFPEDCLSAAVRTHDPEIVRFVLDHGARINHVVDGVTRCFALTDAAGDGDLPIVKLLVGRGADVNATWKDINPLLQAEQYGHREVADYLRAHGAKLPVELFGERPYVPLDAERREAELVEHMEFHTDGSAHPLALREILPTDLPVAIRVLDMQNTRMLFTAGMSARPMTDPESGTKRFAELLIYLPLDWPLDDASLADPRRFWPVEWLRRIARHPHDAGTCLGKAVVFANDEPPEPFAPDTRLSCLLAVTSADESGTCVLSNGDVVEFYSLYPLYAEERDFERKHGTEALLHRFQERRVSRIVDVRRASVATD